MRYETQETSETPLALPPTQMVSTCGTVMSMVKTERPRKTFSSPLTDCGLFGSVTQAPSAGSIAMASLLMTRAHRVARNRIAPGGSLASRPRAKHLWSVYRRGCRNSCPRQDDAVRLRDTNTACSALPL